MLVLDAQTALGCMLAAREEVNRIEAQFGIHTRVPAWERARFQIIGAHPEAYFYGSYMSWRDKVHDVA